MKCTEIAAPDTDQDDPAHVTLTVYPDENTETGGFDVRFDT